MEVLLDLVDEEGHQILWGVLVADRLGLGADLAEDAVELVLSVDLWHIAGRKHIIDVDEELVVDNLRVSEQEKGLEALASRAHEQSLDVSLQVGDTVVGGDDNSEDFVLMDEGGQLGERLLSRTTDSDEQSVSRGLCARALR
jgi:hypothetical protein